MSRRKTILVVGGVAAGTSAAAKAKRTNPDCEVVLFEKGADISYGTCSMPYYISDIVRNPTDLVLYTARQFEQEKGVTVRIHHEAFRIEPYKKLLHLRDHERNRDVAFRYDKLIIATGASARTDGLPVDGAPNVFFLKSLSDAVRIKNFLEQQKPRKALIVGGGFIGMEMAEAFARHGLEIDVLDKAERPMARLEKESSRLVLAELHKHQVRFHGGSDIDRIERGGPGIGRIDTRTRIFEPDLVLFALGFRPNTDFLKGTLTLADNGAIVVNQKQETSRDHIYAAGACAEVRDLITNRNIYFPLASTASKTGRVAGENAAGGRTSFNGVVRTSAVKIFDLQVAHTGLSSEEAKALGFTVLTDTTESWSRPKYYPDRAQTSVSLIVDRRSRRLLGADVLSSQDAAMRVNVLSTALLNRMTIDEISQLDLMYSPPFSSVWDPILVAANSTINQLRK